ncbi:ubiquitin-associated protein 2-like isoform X9 [Osmerus mordax]|uniref:ubiquitin-associated protein 2-like isoform X9 n=1 Tax=Osmerus mordax TaxID=8014 RepID=UPI0035107DF8
MMTSVGGNRARGSWEQTQGQTQSHTQHKQRPQATAEQIRLAQMISDHNDADFEEKVKQLIDITGKDQDESMIALHDCNGDVNRAINVLLEGSPDTDSWEMVGKKKGVSGPKESGQAEVGDEGKENRERGGERDVARRRGGVPRRGRGASRGREFRGQENGLDGSKAAGIAGRGVERGRRGRGRGRGGSGRRGGRFSAQGMGQIDKGPRYDFSGDERTFNPADYAEPAQTEDGYGGGSTWNNTGSVEPEEGARLEYSSAGEGTNYQPKFESAPGKSAWRSATDEWGTEDWNEDLSETKIFTASSVASMPLPQENVTITAGQRIDLAVLLGKTPPSSSSEAENPPLEAAQPPPLSQSLVFSNSKQGGSLSQPPSSTPYSQHSMVSMLSKGYGEVGDPKGGCTGTTSGSQFLEQFKTAQALAQLAAQHSQAGAPNTTTSSWDTSPAALGQYDLKAQAEPVVHAPFTKRQPYQPTTSTPSMIDAFLQNKDLPPSSSASLSHQTAPSSHVAPASSAGLPKMAPVPSLGPQVSPGSSDAQGSSPLPLQQHKLKQQKKRTSITSKIPALAVEMPGSADISGLNLQFGALQFGAEPALPEYDSPPVTSAPGNQAPNSLYTSPSSESTAALPNPGQIDMYDQRAPQGRRYPPSTSSSPQKDLQAKVRLPSPSRLTHSCARLGSSRYCFNQTCGYNGFSSIQMTQSVEAAAGSAVSVKPPSDSTVPASVSSMNDGGSGPASLLSTSNQTSLSVLGHNEDLPPSSMPPPQHSNSLPTQQNSISQSSGRTSNSSLLHQGVDGDSSLHSSSFPSSVSAVASSSIPPLSSSCSSVAAAAQVSLGGAPASSVCSVSSPSGMGPVGNLAMGLGAPSVASMGPPAAASTAASSVPSSRGSAVSSGKAPPNLPPGVPPLLPNPYIMAPGLLHAYPPQMYGYDDLQMLQTRIPLDYYSIPFATNPTALTGREGSLTSNPYSGDLSKFGRGDASSPSPSTTLAQTQQNQSQSHHSAQQPFLNPALPPGYSYTSLPYYTGVPGLPNTFQYGPAMFPVAPTSSKQHGVNVGASATPFQQNAGYGSHGYSTGVSVTSSNTGVPDISGSVYTKTQSFEKQGFHAGTPTASFSLPSALGSGGPINPPAGAAYAPAPFMHILAPHQQPHSQILHHHLQQDGQSGTGQRSQNASIQQKSQINKTAYGSYNWGAN